MSLLVIGSTGTLGRQIVRKALDKGFPVKCLVRNIRKGAFLKEWGAELIYGDLGVPETIPLALTGVTAIIDVSTARASDIYSIKTIDLYGKIALIKAAEVAQIRRFIFFSIINTHKYTTVPLMKFKLKIEHMLQQSPIKYTIFNLSGFFQGLISQYAIPILDEKLVWTTTDSKHIAYIDTQDVAEFAITSLSMPYLENAKLPLIGPQPWTAIEIIQLCEKLSGKKSRVSLISVNLLKLLSIMTSLFQWSWSISERFAFTEVLTDDLEFVDCMNCIYDTFQIYPQEDNTLENYFNEYFGRILKKLEKLNSLNNKQQHSF